MAEPDQAVAGPSLQVAAIWPAGQGFVMVRAHDATTWALPGGAVQPGETLAEAVVRTVADCTGAAALCGPFVGWSELPDESPTAPTVTMYFEAVVLDAAEPDRRSGALGHGPQGHEMRAVPDWEVSEIPVLAGLAEFLADQGLIELVV